MSGKINPSGLCMCGCGEKTKAATMTGRGYKKGDSRKYVNGHNLKKDGRPRWRGGVGTANGYTRVKNPTHPRADVNGYVGEHILIAEKAANDRKEDPCPVK